MLVFFELLGNGSVSAGAPAGKVVLRPLVSKEASGRGSYASLNGAGDGYRPSPGGLARPVIQAELGFAKTAGMTLVLWMRREPNHSVIPVQAGTHASLNKRAD